ncbi:transcriptional regulator [Klebsiella michiganensis]|nr:transcriptional regulator [Klebsiella michiganensis]
MSAKKVTMADIAKEARVGIATVDRVLNKRTPVKESTERKVLESARRLGFALGAIPLSAGGGSAGGSPQNGLHSATAVTLVLPSAGAGAGAGGVTVA